MDARCPTCRADNTQRLQIVHEGGLQTTTSTGVVAGIGYAGIGGEAVGGIGTRGVQQSVLSEKTSPPKKRDGTAIGFVALVSFVGLVWALQAASVGWIFTALIVGLLSLGWLISILNYNGRTWPALYDNWSRTFICLRCGNTFIPDRTFSNAKLITASAAALSDSPPQALQDPTRAISAFCTSCGARVSRANDRFCGACGAGLRQAVDVKQRND